MNCQQCGFLQHVEGKFCNNCGAALPSGSTAPPSKSKIGKIGLVAVGLFLMCGFCGVIGRYAGKPVKPATEMALTLPSSPIPTATIPPVSAETLRALLRVDYEDTMSQSHSHLNFIKAKLSKTKGGYALMAEHTYFSQYTLKIGKTASVITTWMNTNQDKLEKAGIVRVGIKSDTGYGGSAWFDLK